MVLNYTKTAINVCALEFSTMMTMMTKKRVWFHEKKKKILGKRSKTPNMDPACVIVVDHKTSVV